MLPQPRNLSPEYKAGMQTILVLGFSFLSFFLKKNPSTKATLGQKRTELKYITHNMVVLFPRVVMLDGDY